MLTHGKELHQFQVQFPSGDLQASNSNSVLILEDNSYDFQNLTSFVIPRDSQFTSSPLPLLTQFMRRLSKIWQVL
jgi:hypothetical protein